VRPGSERERRRRLEEGVVFAERRWTVGSSFGRRFVAPTYSTVRLFFEGIFIFRSARLVVLSFSLAASPRVSRRPFLCHPSNHKKQIRRTSLETHHANAQLVSRFGKNVFDIFLKTKCMQL
jgi:hypothetical protein